MTKKVNISLTSSVDMLNKLFMQQACQGKGIAWYAEEFSEVNKVLKFSQKSRQILIDQGLHIEKRQTRISHNQAPTLYKALLDIFRTNPDVFVNRVDVENK